MNSLLYPAVAFMNRLSFGMKFSLVSVLFFVPMLLSNFYLVRDSYREFVGTRTELRSLELLGAALQVRRSMEDWKDLVQIESIIGQAGNVETLIARLDKVEGELSAQLQALEPVSEAAEQVAEFNGRRDELVAALG
ncbi:MAG: methyl-accepting chemotaxis protein, partial [Pseudomonas sp.]